MPIPKPTDEQSEDDFMSSCMKNSDMQEYGEDERKAVCARAWSGSDDEDGQMEFIKESVTPTSQSLQLTQDDMTAINRVSMQSLTDKDVFIFAAKIIEADRKTGNNRVFQREWAEDVVKRQLLIGTPISFNHSPSIALMNLGKIYQAEFKGNQIDAKAYVDVRGDEGKQIARDIKENVLKAVSIHSVSKSVRRDGTEYVMKGPDNRMMEVSFLVDKVPGCADCGVTACQCESKQDPMIAFAKEQLQALQNAYVRYAYLNCGDGINKTNYKTVAESVSPETLKALVEDQKRTYANRKGSTEPQSYKAKIETEIERMRQMTGR